MAFTGCRPLSLEEQHKVYDALSGKRDKALFMLQLRCGFRISELLSLRVKDVCTRPTGMQSSADRETKETKESKDSTTHVAVTMFDYITVQRKHAKKKLKGRTVPLNRSARDQLKQWIDEAKLKPDDFPSVDQPS